MGYYTSEWTISEVEFAHMEGVTRPHAIGRGQRNEFPEHLTVFYFGEIRGVSGGEYSFDPDTMQLTMTLHPVTFTETIFSDEFPVTTYQSQVDMPVSIGRVSVIDENTMEGHPITPTDGDADAIVYTRVG